MICLNTVKLRTAHTRCAVFLFVRMISTSFVLFVNHLLSKEPWALARLRPYAGKSACVDLELMQLRVQVGADGFFQALGANTTEVNQDNVTLSIKPADLPLIAQDPKRAVAYVKIEGDADFANVLSGLSQDLKWEVEDDLAKLVGDVPATRLVGLGRLAVSHLQRTHQNLQESFAEYFLEENPTLVRPQAVQSLADSVVKTRDDVERLMKRIEKIERSDLLAHKKQKTSTTTEIQNERTDSEKVEK